MSTLSLKNNAPIHSGNFIGQYEINGKNAAITINCRVNSSAKLVVEQSITGNPNATADDVKEFLINTPDLVDAVIVKTYDLIYNYFRVKILAEPNLIVPSGDVELSVVTETFTTINSGDYFVANSNLSFSAGQVELSGTGQASMNKFMIQVPDDPVSCSVKNTITVEENTIITINASAAMNSTTSATFNMHNNVGDVTNYLSINSGTFNVEEGAYIRIVKNDASPVQYFSKTSIDVFAMRLVSSTACHYSLDGINYTQLQQDGAIMLIGNGGFYINNAGTFVFLLSDVSNAKMVTVLETIQMYATNAEIVVVMKADSVYSFIVDDIAIPYVVTVTSDSSFSFADTTSLVFNKNQGTPSVYSQDDATEFSVNLNIIRPVLSMLSFPITIGSGAKVEATTNTTAVTFNSEGTITMTAGEEIQLTNNRELTLYLHTKILEIAANGKFEFDGDGRLTTHDTATKTAIDSLSDKFTTTNEGKITTYDVATKTSVDAATTAIGVLSDKFTTTNGGRIIVDIGVDIEDGKLATTGGAGTSSNAIETDIMAYTFTDGNTYTSDYLFVGNMNNLKLYFNMRNGASVTVTEYSNDTTPDPNPVLRTTGYLIGGTDHTTITVSNPFIKLTITPNGRQYTSQVFKMSTDTTYSIRAKRIMFLNTARLSFSSDNTIDIDYLLLNDTDGDAKMTVHEAINFLISAGNIATATTTTTISSITTNSVIYLTAPTANDRAGIVNAIAVAITVVPATKIYPNTDSTISIVNAAVSIHGQNLDLSFQVSVATEPAIATSNNCTTAYDAGTSTLTVTRINPGEYFIILEQNNYTITSATCDYFTACTNIVCTGNFNFAGINGDNKLSVPNSTSITLATGSIISFEDNQSLTINGGLLVVDISSVNSMTCTSNRGITLRDKSNTLTADITNITSTTFCTAVCYDTVNYAASTDYYGPTYFSFSSNTALTDSFVRLTVPDNIAEPARAVNIVRDKINYAEFNPTRDDMVVIYDWVNEQYLGIVNSTISETNQVAIKAIEYRNIKLQPLGNSANIYATDGYGPVPILADSFGRLLVKSAAEQKVGQLSVIAIGAYEETSNEYVELVADTGKRLITTNPSIKNDATNAENPKSCTIVGGYQGDNVRTLTLDDNGNLQILNSVYTNATAPNNLKTTAIAGVNANGSVLSLLVSDNGTLTTDVKSDGSTSSIGKPVEATKTGEDILVPVGGVSNGKYKNININTNGNLTTNDFGHIISTANSLVFTNNSTRSGEIEEGTRQIEIIYAFNTHATFTIKQYNSTSATEALIVSSYSKRSTTTPNVETVYLTLPYFKIEVTPDTDTLYYISGDTTAFMSVANVAGTFSVQTDGTTLEIDAGDSTKITSLVNTKLLRGTVVSPLVNSLASITSTNFAITLNGFGNGSGIDIDSVGDDNYAVRVNDCSVVLDGCIISGMTEIEAGETLTLELLGNNDVIEVSADADGQPVTVEILNVANDIYTVTNPTVVRFSKSNDQLVCSYGDITNTIDYASIRITGGAPNTISFEIGFGNGSFEASGTFSARTETTIKRIIGTEAATINIRNLGSGSIVFNGVFIDIVLSSTSNFQVTNTSEQDSYIQLNAVDTIINSAKLVLVNNATYTVPAQNGSHRFTFNEEVHIEQQNKFLYAPITGNLTGSTLITKLLTQTSGQLAGTYELLPKLIAADVDGNLKTTNSTINTSNEKVFATVGGFSGNTAAPLNISSGDLLTRDKSVVNLDGSDIYYGIIGGIQNTVDVNHDPITRNQAIAINEIGNAMVNDLGYIISPFNTFTFTPVVDANIVKSIGVIERATRLIDVIYAFKTFSSYTIHEYHEFNRDTLPTPKISTTYRVLSSDTITKKSHLLTLPYYNIVVDDIHGESFDYTGETSSSITTVDNETVTFIGDSAITMDGSTADTVNIDLADHTKILSGTITLQLSRGTDDVTYNTIETIVSTNNSISLDNFTSPGNIAEVIFNFNTNNDKILISGNFIENIEAVNCLVSNESGSDILVNAHAQLELTLDLSQTITVNNTTSDNLTILLTHIDTPDTVINISSSYTITGTVNSGISGVMVNGTVYQGTRSIIVGSQSYIRSAKTNSLKCAGLFKPDPSQPLTVTRNNISDQACIIFNTSFFGVSGATFVFNGTFNAITYKNLMDTINSQRQLTFKINNSGSSANYLQTRAVSTPLTNSTVILVPNQTYSITNPGAGRLFSFDAPVSVTGLIVGSSLTESLVDSVFITKIITTETNDTLYGAYNSTRKAIESTSDGKLTTRDEQLNDLSTTVVNSKYMKTILYNADGIPYNGTAKVIVQNTELEKALFDNGGSKNLRVTLHGSNGNEHTTLPVSDSSVDGRLSNTNDKLDSANITLSTISSSITTTNTKIETTNTKLGTIDTTLGSINTTLTDGTTVVKIKDSSGDDINSTNGELNVVQQSRKLISASNYAEQITGVYNSLQTNLGLADGSSVVPRFNAFGNLRTELNGVSYESLLESTPAFIPRNLTVNSNYDLNVAVRGSTFPNGSLNTNSMKLLFSYTKELSKTFKTIIVDNGYSVLSYASRRIFSASVETASVIKQSKFRLTNQLGIGEEINYSYPCNTVIETRRTFPVNDGILIKYNVTLYGNSYNNSASASTTEIGFAFRDKFISLLTFERTDANTLNYYYSEIPYVNKKYVLTITTFTKNSNNIVLTIPFLSFVVGGGATNTITITPTPTAVPTSPYNFSGVTSGSAESLAAYISSVINDQFAESLTVGTSDPDGSRLIYPINLSAVAVGNQVTISITRPFIVNGNSGGSFRMTHTGSAFTFYTLSSAITPSYTTTSPTVGTISNFTNTSNIKELITVYVTEDYIRFGFDTGGLVTNSVDGVRWIYSRSMPSYDLKYTIEEGFSAATNGTLSTISSDSFTQSGDFVDYNGCNYLNPLILLRSNTSNPQMKLIINDIKIYGSPESPEYLTVASREFNVVATTPNMMLYVAVPIYHIKSYYAVNLVLDRYMFVVTNRTFKLVKFVFCSDADAQRILAIKIIKNAGVLYGTAAPGSTLTLSRGTNQLLPTSVELNGTDRRFTNSMHNKAESIWEGNITSGNYQLDLIDHYLCPGETLAVVAEATDTLQSYYTFYFDVNN